MSGIGTKYSVHKDVERAFAVLHVNNIQTVVTVGTPSKRKEI